MEQRSDFVRDFKDYPLDQESADYDLAGQIQPATFLLTWAFWLVFFLYVYVFYVSVPFSGFCVFICSVVTMLCRCHHYLIPYILLPQNRSSLPIVLPVSCLWLHPLATTHLFSISMDFPILDTSHEWNHILCSFLYLTSLIWGLPLWLRQVKNLPVMWETSVWPLSQEDPLEKGMATHSSVLAWRILWSLTGYSPWGRKESDTTEWLTSFSFP